jgi:CheY-like chemotaxis protein
MSNPLALIIEDHPQQASVFQKALQVAGFETEVVMDGKVAQQRLTEVVPYLITLDLHIPDVSGDMLLAQVRSDERLKGTYVFLTTADALQAELLRRNAQLVLLKPISFTQLVELAKRFHPSRNKKFSG